MRKDIEFRTSQHGQWLVLKALGRIDTNTATQAGVRATEALKQTQKLALECSDLEYLSSAGLRMLVVLAKSARSQKKEFAVVGMHGICAEVFRQSGLNMMVGGCESVADLR